MGPNGCGKSTLLRTVCGIMVPQAGSVRADGLRLCSIDPKEYPRVFGYVPQRYVPSDRLTVFESVLIGRATYMSWTFSDEDFTYAEAAMERMGIMELAETFVNDVSGGQMQKVAIARALAQNPSYYVMDEPTSALDLKNRMVVMRIIRDTVSEEKSGALLAMHDINLAIRFSDEIVMLRDGTVYARGSPDDIVTEESIRDVYGVASEIFEGKDGRFVHILEGRFISCRSSYIVVKKDLNVSPGRTPS